MANWVCGGYCWQSWQLGRLVCGEVRRICCRPDCGLSWSSDGFRFRYPLCRRGRCRGRLRRRGFGYHGLRLGDTDRIERGLARCWIDNDLWITRQLAGGGGRRSRGSRLYRLCRLCRLRRLCRQAETGMWWTPGGQKGTCGLSRRGGLAGERHSRIHRSYRLRRLSDSGVCWHLWSGAGLRYSGTGAWNGSGSGSAASGSLAWTGLQKR